MRKWIAVAGLMGGLIGPAQAQEVARLELSPQELSIVLQALGQMPYTTVAPVIIRIQTQVQTQIQEQQKKVAPPTPPAPPAEPKP